MKMRNTAICVTCAALASPAAAQHADSVPESTLKAVTVTANKVEEKLKDVPQSITLITGEEVQEKGIRNVGDLVREIPNLSSTFLYSEDVNIRGINSSTFTNTNPVVIYVDGIPQSNRYAYDALLENVERVEVLRGPQGSLYGKDSIGGVINIVTKGPKDAWSGQVGGEISNHSGYETTLSVSGPVIKDTLYLTFSGKKAGDDGWVTNHQPGMNSDANRKSEDRFNLGLLYKASPDTTIRLNASRDRQSNYWIGGGMIPAGSDYRAYSRNDARDAAFDQDTLTKTVADAQSLSIQHKFGAITLDAITTHKSVKMDGDYDSDWGNSALYAGLTQFQHSKTDTLSQEVRFSGGEAGRLRWISGFYFENDKYRNTRYGMQYPASLMGNPFGVGVNIDMDDVSTTKTETRAVFGQLMLPLTERLELTLGGRYQQIDKSMDSDFTMQPVGASGYPPSISLDADHHWRTFLPKVALSYELTPNWKTYASVAKGYLPGGYNYWTSSNVEEENRFDPQTSTNYEFGIRSDFGPLYLSASLFYMDIKDIHTYSFNSATGMIYTSNAGQAHSKGAEIEASYLVNDRWEVSGALGVVSARYDEYSDTTSNGNRIEKTPAYTARLGLKYTAGNGLYGRVDVRGQGKRYFNPENTFQDGAYATVDLKAGYKTGPWDFYAYVRNLTDESYLTSVMSQSNGTLVTFGEPRRFGVGARYSF